MTAPWSRIAAEICAACLTEPRCGVGDLCEECAANAEEARERRRQVPLTEWGTRQAWETEMAENDYERWLGGEQ